MSGQPDVVRQLRAWNDDPKLALGEMMPSVVGELRQIASRLLTGEPEDHTLQATELVNELYLRLVDRRTVSWADRAHFFAFAARTMRRILVDRGRARHADKRGGRLRRAELPAGDEVPASTAGFEIEALHDALDSLGRVDPGLERLVELRFFVGLTLRETAEILDVSVPTVHRSWRVARAWLVRELTGGERSVEPAVREGAGVSG